VTKKTERGFAMTAEHRRLEEARQPSRPWTPPEQVVQLGKVALAVEG
jgi:hypothetical protein